LDNDNLFIIISEKGIMEDWRWG